MTYIKVVTTRDHYIGTFLALPKGAIRYISNVDEDGTFLTISTDASQMSGNLSHGWRIINDDEASPTSMQEVDDADEVYFVEYGLS